MFKGLKFFIKFSWSVNKSYAVLNIINQLLTAFLSILLIVIPKYLIDELFGEQRIDRIVIYVGVLLLSIFLNNWLLSFINFAIFNRRCELAAHFSKFMHGKLANTDFSNLEDPAFHDMREKANKFLYGDWHGFSYVLESAFSIFGKVCTLAGIMAIVSTMNIGIVLLFVAMVALSAAVDAKAKEKSHKLSLEAVQVERRWSYFGSILEDVSYAKEVRMNNIDEWLINQEMAYAEKSTEFYRKRNKYFSASNLFNSFSLFIQNLTAYIFLIYNVIYRGMSVGNFSMYIGAVTTFSSSVRDVLSSFIDIKVYGIYYEALDRYINIPETLRQNKKLPLIANDDFDITFHDVSFKFSAVFQDYKLFAFSVKDNILFDKDTAENSALADELLGKIGMREKIEALQNGIDTNIHKEFDPNGFEPSGGEGQKIAIARALARNSNVIILDEPLSSLDPKAEYEIFRMFDELIAGKTAIYISHRLSSCRFCDAIAVFNGGEIVEYGTHDSLMAIDGGKYNEFYNLQAQYYAE